MKRTNQQIADSIYQTSHMAADTVAALEKASHLYNLYNSGLISLDEYRKLS